MIKKASTRENTSYDNSRSIHCLDPLLTKIDRSSFISPDNIGHGQNALKISVGCGNINVVVNQMDGGDSMSSKGAPAPAKRATEMAGNQLYARSFNDTSQKRH